MRELSDFDEMYQEVIIDHYKNPRNKAKLTSFTDETLSHNPFCGDEIELQLFLSLIHICRCRRLLTCRSRWSPYH